MLIFIGQVMLLFIFYVVSIRILGKSALAQLTAHDFGALFFLAYILFGSLEVEGISQGIIGGIVVVLLYVTIAKLSLWNKVNSFLIGKPTFLIKQGEIMSHNLKKSRYTLLELLSIIRTAGYFDISEIDYALLEPNGEISVLPKKENGFVTPKHLDVRVENKGLPIVVIVEGEIQQHNLPLIEKEENWLKRELHVKGYEQLNDIFLATVREKDHFIQVYKEQK